VDWYIDELQRLEDKLLAEQSKYKKLYGRKNVIPKAVEMPKEEKAKPIPIRPIYPTNLRFS
jgi:hypothetical protein